MEHLFKIFFFVASQSRVSWPGHRHMLQSIPCFFMIFHISSGLSFFNPEQKSWYWWCDLLSQKTQLDPACFCTSFLGVGSEAEHLSLEYGGFRFTAPTSK